jgi:hypothetical protein
MQANCRSMDSLSRLDRPIIGSRQLIARPIVERAEARSRVRAPIVVLPDHSRQTEVRIRPSSLRIDPAPNAPQLIRLNRNPFPLHRGTFERTRRTTFSLARPERLQVAEMIDEARAALVRIDSDFRPTPTSLHLRPEPRPRLSAAAWLDGNSDE